MIGSKWWLVGAAAAFLAHVSACGDGASDAADAAAVPQFDAAPAVDAFVCSVDITDALDPAAGFAHPMAVTRAHEEVQGMWVDMGPANWTCLGTPTGDVPSTVTIDLSGAVEDFQTGNPVDGASITVYGGDDISALPIATGTSTIGGDFAIALPVGTLRPTFRLQSAGAVDTYITNADLEPSAATQFRDLFSVGVLTADALPAFVGVERSPALGLGVWTVRDCDGRTVSNAIATMSSESECPLPLPGSTAFYFSAGTNSLPVRHSQRAATSADGLVLLAEIPPMERAHLQVWGLVDGQSPNAAPTLLAEVPLTITPNSYITSDLEPLRAE